MAFGVGGWAKGQQAPAAPASPIHESEPITTFKAATRMVTIDVVARDGKGNSLRDLKPNNFEVLEQIEPRREKYVQKIAAFRTTSVAELAALDPGKPKMAPGVYTNLVTMNRVPVPPTIILYLAGRAEHGSIVADAGSATDQNSFFDTRRRSNCRVPAGQAPGNDSEFHNRSKTFTSHSGENSCRFSANRTGVLA